MIEDMHNVMLRINEIKTRFGLMQPKRETVNQGETLKDKNFSEMLEEKLGVLYKPYGILPQLMPQTAMELGIENPFDPEENIKGGVTLLKSLIDKNNGDYKLALAAYNAGQKTVDRAGGIPDFKETKEYVKKVLDLYIGDER